MAKCQKCGVDNPEGSKFCASCGSPIPQQVSPATGSKCLQCGTENPAGGKFCLNCGKPLAQVISVPGSPAQGVVLNRCPRCGAENPPGGRFCGGCGASLQPATYGATPQAPSAAPISAAFATLTPYYQEEFRKIQESNETYKGKWNWAAFFLSVFWGFYRGVWARSLVLLVAPWIMYFIAFSTYEESFSWLGILISLAASIVFGLRGNHFYYNAFVKKKQW